MNYLIGRLPPTSFSHIRYFRKSLTMKFLMQPLLRIVCPNWSHLSSSILSLINLNSILDKVESQMFSNQIWMTTRSSWCSNLAPESKPILQSNSLPLLTKCNSKIRMMLSWFHLNPAKRFRLFQTSHSFRRLKQKIIALKNRMLLAMIQIRLQRSNHRIPTLDSNALDILETLLSQKREIRYRRDYLKNLNWLLDLRDLM